MYGRFEYVTNLQHKVKSLQSQVDGFKSGKKYTGMRSEFKAQLAEKDREVKRLKVELGDANCRTVTVRKNCQQVLEDMEDDYEKKLEEKDRRIKELEGQVYKLGGMLDDEKDKVAEKSRELYRVMVELEEEKGKNMKLMAQINRDHENSSIPSSLKPNHKKIANSREKTGKKPGGQPGHKGHGRKKHEPTSTIEIPAPEKYAGSPGYKPTGNVVAKQMVNILVWLVVDECRTPEFRNVRTGQRVHAEFPPGVVNDVNYGGSVKAFAFLLNNRCNVSIENTTGFISELTGGKLRISTGMVNGLSKEFSAKTEAEQKKAFADMLLSPVMNMDFTSARVGGQKAHVAVCATPTNVLYFAREHKGHEGVKGTPAEHYQHTLVHDHDKTFSSYGSRHQECNAHPVRYLKDSMDNEPGLTWNMRMRELLREMIHFRNSLGPGIDKDPDQIDPDRVKTLEARYDEVLALAKDEYEYEPPTKYYMEGFNLYKRLSEYKDDHLLFLHDRKVPPSNNLAEQLLRVYKRKQHQVMTFRSFESLDFLCRSLGTVATLRAQGESLYESAAAMFDRPKGVAGNIVT